MKILIVEDDFIIAGGLEYILQEEGFEVALAHNVKDAFLSMEKETYDLYLLDLSLPDGSGYDICKKVKGEGDAPVIFLTAVDDEVNVVMGLDMGADDYITKPFRIRELVSRIKSVLRRYSKNNGNDTSITIRDIKINLNEAKVYRGNEELGLTAMEYRLLLTFVKNRGQILSRSQLLEQIWDVSGDFINDNTLSVYIKRLREKLEEKDSKQQLIRTVRGLGYIMDKE